MNQKEESTTVVHHPFRRAVLRGLGIVLPPLLTMVVFLWAWGVIESNVLIPLETGVRNVSVWWIRDVRERVPSNLPNHDVVLEDNRVVKFRDDGKEFVQIPSGQWIPASVYDVVQRDPGESPPVTGTSYYHRYIDLRYLKRGAVVPVFLCVFILVLYMVGKLMAAGAGRILWNSIESLIHRLPVIRNVYSSVKQVTDFVFSEQAIEFNRVVAVEYPRKGIWSIGFVTGESLLDISSAANQPVLSVLMPTSPMPMTGFTITVRKSETIDLNLTIDQAIQFVVSCGVVVPPQQQVPRTDRIGGKISTDFGGLEKSNGSPRPEGGEDRSPTSAQERESEDA